MKCILQIKESKEGNQQVDLMKRYNQNDLNH
jgi:hypothetical protein